MSARFGVDWQGGGFGDRLSQAATGAAGAIAGAATRSALTGTSFGDNVLAVLPDVVGMTIGSMVARGVTGSGRSGAVASDDAAAAESRAEPGGSSLGVQSLLAQAQASADRAGAGIAAGASQRQRIAKDAVPIYAALEPGQTPATYDPATNTSIVTASKAQREKAWADFNNYTFGPVDLSWLIGPSTADVVRAIPRWIDSSYSWGGRDWVSQGAAQRAGATFLSTGPSAADRQRGLEIAADRQF